MRYFCLIVCCLMLCSCKEKKLTNEDRGLITPVILNTNSFEDFKPGWETNGYIETNGCLISTNYKISATVEE